MGSTSDLEMNIVVRESIMILENQYGVHVDRAYSSKYAASMEMAGVSITLMLLNEERAACLDFPVRAPIWQCPVLPHGLRNRFTPSPLSVNLPDVENSSGQTGCDGAQLTEDEAEVLLLAITRACEVLIKNDEMLNDLDSVVGDGDCGSTLANGAKGILDVLHGTVMACRGPCKVLLEMAQSVEQSMGGSSGALYSLFLTSASHQLQSETAITSNSWIRALKRGIDTVSLYGGANPGDRTMLDPLNAAWSYASEHCTQDKPHLVWKAAVDAARLEAERTAEMRARAGRASYVNAELVTRPDAGAIGCVLWMSAAFDVYEDSSVD